MALSDEPCLQVLVVLVLERTCLLVVIAICKNGMFENGSCESLTKSTPPLLQPAGPGQLTSQFIGRSLTLTWNRLSVTVRHVLSIMISSLQSTLHVCRSSTYSGYHDCRFRALFQCCRPSLLRSVHQTASVMRFPGHVCLLTQSN